MKTLKITSVALLALLAASCSDDDNKNTAKLSSQEQADMVASSLGESGFSGSAEQSAGYADDADGSSGKTAECGFTNTGSFNISSTGFSLAYNYDVELTCDGNENPESFTSEFEYTGSYDGPRFESEYSGSGFLTVTSLGEEGNSFEINGAYDRSGDFTTKVGNEVSGSHSIEIDANSVMVSKANHTITDGSASVSASGSIDGRGSYSFDADVTFNNNGTATIDVAGDTYTLTFSSNTLVKVD